MATNGARRSRSSGYGDHINFAAVEQRVYTTEQGIQALSVQVDTRLNSFSDSINRRIDRLSEALEKKSSPQFQTMFSGIAVLLTVIGMIGTIVYVLIQSQINSNAQQTITVANSVERVGELVRDRYVPRIELDGWRTDDKDRAERMGDALIELRKNSITLSDHSALVDRLSRVEQQFGATYSVGDVLKDIQSRLSAIERAGSTSRVQLQSGGAVVP